MNTTTNRSPSPSRNTQLSHALNIDRLFRGTVDASDKPVIEQMLKEAEGELTGCHTEINKIKASLFALERKRDGLKKKIAIFRSLMSPIHRLPPEVLRMIFPLTLVGGVNWLDPSFTAPALVLSATCGRWRSIVLSTPSIWSRIGIDAEQWEEKKDTLGLSHLIRLFLERSDQALLTIELCFGDTSLDTRMQTCIEAIVCHSRRWESVVFSGTRSDVIGHPVFRPIKGNLPVLSHLDVNCSSKAEDDETIARFRCDLFGVCPKLASIDVRPDCPINKHFTLPWYQITALVVRDTYYNIGLPYLRLCPLVESLALHQIGETSGRLQGWDGPVTCNAKQLSIKVFTKEDFATLLPNMTLNALSSLEICGRNKIQFEGWAEWNSKVVPEFLFRSGCMLTSLTLKHVPITDGQAIRLLHQVSSLTYLHLEEYCIMESPATNRVVTRAFFNELIVDHQRPSSAPFLPRLNYIKFVLHFEEQDQQRLLKALASRWIPGTASEAGVSCLKTVDVIFIESQDTQVEDLVEELQWLKEAGMLVRIAARMSEDSDSDSESDSDDEDAEES
ncbi:hypothetical protein VNI00_008749 [Paramarasmius palmivorus]|uniref:F-box domain-containing protein n=1 Tax=Paramarasmius palmivorus TaxID=297713 RepID=A0AAW0CT94_9AGAR